MSDVAPEVPPHDDSNIPTRKTRKPDEEVASELQVEDTVTRMLPKIDKILANTTTNLDQTEKVLQAIAQLDTSLKQPSASVKETRTELTGERPSLLDVQNRYEREIERLRKEVSKQKDDNAKLHSMIQRPQGTSGAIPDAEVAERFEKLRFRISEFAGIHFGNFRNTSEQRPFNSMKESDRSLYLQAGIAFYIHFDMFKTSFFGLDEPLEGWLREMEKRLDDRDVPLDEIDSWRVRTVRIARHLRTPESKHAIVRDFSTKVLKQDLASFVKLIEPTAAAAAMEELYAFAYELALAIRTSKTEFVWEHRTELKQEDIADFDILFNYCEPDTHGHHLSYNMLFGPVYKYGDEGRVRICKGALLTPGKNMNKRS